MDELSERGTRGVDDISREQGFSRGAVLHMLAAVTRGNGRMAQFSHPEFGGAGQWMAGGMTMIADMFNDELKGRVDRLCRSLSVFQHDTGNFTKVASKGLQSGASEAFRASRDHATWWPTEFGNPTSTGAQNNCRYAYFSHAQRLVVVAFGKTTVYDTRGHEITGFSQQQSSGASMTFVSDRGPVDLGSLPIVAVTEAAHSSTPPAQLNANGPGRATSKDELFLSIEKLADLHARGFLSQEEFDRKKEELLRRL